MGPVPKELATTTFAAFLHLYHKSDNTLNCAGGPCNHYFYTVLQQLCMLHVSVFKAVDIITKMRNCHFSMKYMLVRITLLQGTCRLWSFIYPDVKEQNTMKLTPKPNTNVESQLETKRFNFMNIHNGKTRQPLRKHDQKQALLEPKLLNNSAFSLNTVLFLSNT